MTKLKTIVNSLLAIGLASAIFSCNSNTETAKEEPKKMADSPVVSQPAAPTPVAQAQAPAPFTPFDIAEISHKVKDYAKWRLVFNSDSVNRKAAGMEDLVVSSVIDNNNDIEIVLKVSDIQKAKDFAANPKLKEAMEKGGVISKPAIEFFHVIRFNPDSKEKQWVEVTHKVKDFEAWLKVFDGEGTAGRASQGLIDVVLARGITDSNMVQLIFDIKDMAKAKASITSEDKKKLMMGAGVIGMPKIIFYKAAD